MRRAKITSGGRVSVPADIRRRWGTRTVSFEDRGDHLVVRPLPDDPIAAAYGAFRGMLPPTEELRRIAREDERRAEERRQKA